MILMICHIIVLADVEEENEESMCKRSLLSLSE